MKLLIKLHSLRVNNDSLYNRTLVYHEEILTKDSLKKYRKDLLNIIKTVFNRSRDPVFAQKYKRDSCLKKYIKVPISCPLLTIKASYLFD